jgi:F-type H+-transporting ATPase subunit gamma
MKMVAASKMRGAEQRLMAGRPFAASLAQIYPQPEKEFDEGLNVFHASTDSASNHFCLVTSDRGLCGGVNTFVCKTARIAVEEFEGAGTADPTINIIGDKGRAQMARVYGDKITSTVDECYNDPMNFSTASALASPILDSDADMTHVMYNKFVSAIQYDTSIMELPNMTKKAADGEEGPFAHLDAYEFEPENKGEALEDFKEFTTAVALYGALVEGTCSEMSSKMQAMENASSNAGDMIERLTLQYNRARQAVITTELIEIISGASALDD